MDKAPDAFRTISEVADHLETPAHVLRFWETRFPQVKPVKGAGGRRYYRPSDVALLSGIRRLLHNDGMTIRGVQKILREQGVRHVAELGGEALEAPEPLEALLPPPKPAATIVPLRPTEPLAPASSATDELSAIRSALSAMRMPDRDAPPPEETLANPADWSMPAEPGVLATEEFDGIDMAAFDGPLAAPSAAAQQPEDEDGSAATEPATEEAAPRPFAAPLGGFGGFGLDLDVPRGGEGGFIAFSDGVAPTRAAPEGFVHPEARPKAKPGVQPSLFDLMAEDQGVVEEAPEAPHVFVEDDGSFDLGAEITAFRSDEAEDTAPPQAEAPSEFPLPQDEAPWDLPPESLPGTSAGAPGQDSDEPQPETAQPETPLPQAADSAPAPVALAGLAPRLRALPGVRGESLFALADLQARLGLLHAQMAEASARPRRNPGE
ncbi:MerR family transcriptional regulator [Stagnihabitans tardus]|uniref:MerR family transcriptional regulator n=1 Tax=Stagnihabitans tardus TaxID=2699202 RepID=UPI001D111813|nr:MerR family transcriptional regulator [Stagnihabitans tardus]